jgi:hypothetical protein
VAKEQQTVDQEYTAEKIDKVENKESRDQEIT